ncbi:ABC transporter ATP-binding protein [Bifidobacterium favimelis]|uniref:ABC transporter ATP-binding protein n=1 Tax=Bifidobacterium favimelis TaxID=3122979 RepID=A0ABU8ZQ63_9BIFI
MLRCSRLSFTYEDALTPSLEHVSFSAGEGRLTVVTGRSGCGKTTLSRIINGLIPELYEGTLEGECLVAGVKTTGQPIYRLSKTVGSVFQNPKTQFFTTDVRSELAFPLENTGVPRQAIQARMDRVASLFGIGRLLDRDMFSLSGGEKQLVAIASACMADPAILVLDEPSGNLDVEAVQALTAALGRLKDLGLTILVIEHRLYYLKDLADDFLIMEDGRLIRQLDRAGMLAMDASERVRLGLRSPDTFPPNSPDPLSAMQDGQTPEGVTDQPERPGKSPRNRLRVEGLTFRYGRQGRRNQEVPALQVDDLTITDRRITGVIGRNGAGKSTLANLLTGLLKADGGCRFTLNGRQVSGRDLVENSYMVFQDVNYQLFCESVRKELLLGAAHPELLDRVAADLDLSDLLDRHPSTLSGGQKQRVAIGAAILADRRLVILDEPTSGLDLYHMNQVSQAIRTMHERGSMVLVISHDEEFLQQTCHRFLTLRGGRVAADRERLDSLIASL